MDADLAYSLWARVEEQVHSESVCELEAERNIGAAPHGGGSLEMYSLRCSFLACVEPHTCRWSHRPQLVKPNTRERKRGVLVRGGCVRRLSPCGFTVFFHNYFRYKHRSNESHDIARPQRMSVLPSPRHQRHHVMSTTVYTETPYRYRTVTI